REHRAFDPEPRVPLQGDRIMKCFRIAMVGSGLVAALATSWAHAAPTLDREFRYGADRVKLWQQDGVAQVSFRGGMQEFRSGRPDLPTVGEQVEVPVGYRVAGVTVTALETAPLGTGLRMASAVEVRHGMAPDTRTAPDAAYYERAGCGAEPAGGPLGRAHGRRTQCPAVPPHPGALAARQPGVLRDHHRRFARRHVPGPGRLEDPERATRGGAHDQLHPPTVSVRRRRRRAHPHVHP